MTQDFVLAPLVLLVDDHVDTREMYAYCLSQFGLRTATAEDVRDALAKARALRPDLILTDINLPEMTGLELRRMLREHEQTEGIPVVALTGSVSLADERHPLAEAGFAAVLIKPCLPDHLLSEIERILEMSRRPATDAETLRGHSP